MITELTSSFFNKLTTFPVVSLFPRFTVQWDSLSQLLDLFKGLCNTRDDRD
jgi:hypothetical protein